MRSAMCNRETAETFVFVEINLDAEPAISIETTSVMFKHLLAQFAFHSSICLTVKARSKDRIQHHEVEDVAIVLGQAVDTALAKRNGIERYGLAVIPMDDALVRCALDLGARAFARVTLPLGCETVEDLSTAMVSHFFSTFALNARMTIHIDYLAGSDPHHIVEAAFKGLGRAFAHACSRHMTSGIPSTKGQL